VSYGAFTFAFCQALRKAREEKLEPTFNGLVKLTLEKIHRLGYRQTPEILGPAEVIGKPMPLVPKPGRRASKKTKAKE
jgi:hypothetical protein